MFGCNAASFLIPLQPLSSAAPTTPAAVFAAASAAPFFAAPAAPFAARLAHSVNPSCGNELDRFAKEAAARTENYLAR